MVILSEEEKREMCVILAKHLPKLREVLGLSQNEFAKRCGISPPRLSVIENGHHVMSWSQLTSILFICAVNKRTKEYFFANRLLSARLIQFLQMKDDNIPPEINVCVDEVIVAAYSKEYLKKLVSDLPPQEVISKQERLNILDKTSREVLFEYNVCADVFKYSYNTPEGDTIQGAYKEYLQNKVYENTVHPDFYTSYAEILQAATITPTEISFEYKTRIATLEYKWHSLSFHSAKDIDGKIKSVYGRIVNIDQLVTERDAARKKADTDSMTGFLNKEALKERINETRKPDVKSCALMMIDIDDFKTVNDNHGHVVGDELLCRCAEQIQKVFRAEDIIGRFGGDEFIVFMVNTVDDTVRQRAQTLVQVISDGIFAESVKITCSIGVICSRDEKETADSLIGMADKAMYCAKQRGKNQVYFWDEV